MKSNKSFPVRFRIFIHRWGAAYLLALPGLVYFFINKYIPMAGIVVAFKKYTVKKGIFGSDWIGLKNFEFLFKSEDAFIITRNTILYNLLFILLNMIIGIGLAIIISDVTLKFARKIYQSAVLLPFLMSIIIASYIVYALFSADTGMVNNSIFKALGKEPVSWYQTKAAWPWILTITNVWKSVGYSVLIYIAGIAGIDKTYYEAAKLDGAGRWQQIRRITVPCLMPTIITLTLMNIGRIFYSDFGLFYQVPMDSGMLYSVTNVIDTYVYRALISAGNIGMSAAAGFYQSIVGFILVLAANGVVRRVSKENAMF